nr:NAD(P)H-binding protein [uncultured Sphingosinicella sp.]
MILIVGASGRLGRAVAKELLERGHKVRAGCRTPSKLRDLQELGAEIVRIDLREHGSFSPALAGVSSVFTAAHGLTGRASDSIARVDVEGHKRLIDASVRARIERFVHTSALGADPLHRAPFMRAKADLERHLAASGLDYAILRPSAFMDLYAHDLIGSRVLAGKRVVLLGRGNSRRNLVAVADVASAAVALIEAPEPLHRIVEIGGADNLSDREVAQVYGQVSGKAAKVLALPPAALRLLAALLGPFHAGVANVLRFPLQTEGRSDLVSSAADLSALIGRDPIGVEAFARSR